MNNFFKSVRTLLNETTYQEKIGQFIDEPIAKIEKAHRLLSSLTAACLLKQFSSDIGRQLVLNKLPKLIDLENDIENLLLTTDADFSALAAAGDQAFNAMIPGKKSAVIRLVASHTKLSFSDLYLIEGLLANLLFVSMRDENQNHTDTEYDWIQLLPTKNDVIELSPELTAKDYETIGVRSILRRYDMS